MGQVLRGVELFASGEYRGRTYTPAEIDEMAANGKAFAAVLHPPAVKGHEETNPDGTPTAAPEEGRTDIPAEAWVRPETLYAKWKQTPVRDKAGNLKVIRQRVLCGDVGDLDDDMADMIRRRKYRKVSAEVYDDFTDDTGESHGKALRRIAFLGGEPPQVKGLADLPMPVAAFAEAVRGGPYLTPAGGRATDRGTFVAFAEVSVATRDENLQVLQALMPGVQPATWTGMTDDQLADLAKNPPSTTPASQPTTAPETAPMVDRAALIAALVAAGQPQAQLDAMTDEQLAALAAQLGVQVPAPAAAAVPAQPAAPMADGDPAAAPADDSLPSVDELKELLIEVGADPATLEGKSVDELMAMLDEMEKAAAGTAPPAQPAAPMSDKARKYSERVIAESKAYLAQIRLQKAETKRERVTTFCENVLVRKGIIYPAQKADYVAMLLATPDVAKFSDTGVKLTVSALDKKMADLSRRQPIVRFGERVPARTPSVADRKTRFVEKLGRFAELHAASIKSTEHRTPQKFVAKFSEAFDKNPDAAEAAFADFQ